MGHTKLRDDYDHRGAAAMIRLLEKDREALFKNRARQDGMITPVVNG